MNRTYNWAILGAGSIARKFANDLKLLPNARLYAVGSRSAQRANEFAAQFAIPHAFDSYEALVADPDIDIVYIASRHTGHYPDTMRCLNHGKHVLCEKPVAMNTAQFEKMAALADENRLFFMEALWTRFVPSFIKCREMIDKGVIGTLQVISSDFCLDIPYNPESRIYNPALGGGSLLDIGLYPVFCAMEMGSPVTTITATARLNEQGIDTFCSMLFSHEGGEHSVLYSTITASGRNEALIHGSNGMLRLNRWWHAPTSLDLIRNNRETEHFIFDEPGNGYQYEAAEVMHCLDTGKTASPLWPPAKSRELLRLLDAIRAQTGIVYPAEIETV